MNSNNWCGSSPIFFEKLNRRIIGPQLLPPSNFNFDWTGLELFLQSGYCLFGLTPFEGYSYLQANEVMIDGVIASSNVKYLENLADQPSASPHLAIEAIGRWVRDLEKSTSEKIIIPLSGGMDSRLLISFIQDKSRIEAFTYGQSLTQNKSNEVVTAMALSKKLNFKWQHIELGGYSSYTSEWIKKWGSSTHAHGMYQMQFYEKISKLVPSGSIVLSGIIGDLLAGSLPPRKFSCPDDLRGLTLTRDMNAYQIITKLERSNHLNQAAEILAFEFEKYEHLLTEKRATDLLTIQNKNMLLRYLVQVPTWYGFKSESPFLNEEIGIKILCIEEKERSDRKWQREYLQEIGIGDHNLGKRGLFSNVLNFSEINNGFVNPSDLRDVSRLISIETKNEMICNIEKLRHTRFKIYLKIAEVPILKHIGRLLIRMSRKNFKLGIGMYYSYLTLLPLQRKELQ
jgi:hypothetical protein